MNTHTREEGRETMDSPAIPSAQTLRDALSRLLTELIAAGASEGDTPAALFELDDPYSEAVCTVLDDLVYRFSIQIQHGAFDVDASIQGALQTARTVTK